jgi:hypothetical protein
MGGAASIAGRRKKRQAAMEGKAMAFQGVVSRRFQGVRVLEIFGGSSGNQRSWDFKYSDPLKT